MEAWVVQVLVASEAVELAAALLESVLTVVPRGMEGLVKLGGSR